MIITNYTGEKVSIILYEVNFPYINQARKLAVQNSIFFFSLRILCLTVDVSFDEMLFKEKKFVFFKFLAMPLHENDMHL